MTDQELLSVLQSDLLETPDGGATASTPLWTPAEYLTTLNERQTRFLAQTGLVAAVASLNALAGQAVYDLPTDCAQILRAAWVTGAGVATDLSLLDTWEADLGLERWGVDRERPSFYHVHLTPARRLRLIRAPLDRGTVHLLYVSSGATVDGSGQTLATPEDWVDYVRWGMHAALLGKTGPAIDVVRAGYAAERFEEGVVLSRLLLDQLAGGLSPEEG